MWHGSWVIFIHRHILRIKKKISSKNQPPYKAVTGESMHRMCWFKFIKIVIFRGRWDHIFYRGFGPIFTKKKKLFL